MSPDAIHSECREPEDRAARVRVEPLVPQGALERSALFEILSERLLGDFSVDLWRQVFVGSAYETVRFETGVVAFVAIQGLPGEWTERDVSALAERYCGHVEAYGPLSALAFSEPRRGLEVAILLQRTLKSTVRIAMVLAPCTLASFSIGGARRSISLGSEANAAGRLTASTAQGCVLLSAEAYALLATVIAQRDPDAVVTTEVHQGVISSAMIALPPPLESGLSTFAGLGLTPKGRG